MRSKTERTIRLLLAGVSFAYLLGGVFTWAVPVRQVRIVGAPGPAAATVPQTIATPQQLREVIAKKIGPGQVKSLPKRSNPRAANPAHANMIATLRTQKQAADAQRSAILSSQRLAPKGLGTGAATLPPAHTMGNPITTSPAMGAMRMSKNKATPPIPAGQGMARGPCTRPTIVTVNGQSKGTVFTPDPQFNLYTITGCMFGDRQGQAYIYGTFAAAQVALQIEFWSDTQIVARVDPQITGELDQNNVTLVVVPSAAAQVQKPGFKFYAMRETTLLTKVPMGWVALAQVASSDSQYVDFGSGKPSQYLSPTTTGTFAGMSAEVARRARNTFPGGQDLFDFSKLRPGFTTESMALNYAVLPDDGGGGYQVNGTWNAEWVGDNIRVTWQMQHQHSPGGLLDDSWDISLSDYGLSVWVSGPKGVSPAPN